MAVVIPPGFAQFVMRWESPNFVTGGGATVLGWGGTGSPGQTPQEFAEIIRDLHGIWLAPRQDSDYRLASVYWQTEENSGEVQANRAGELNLESAAPNCALLNSYRTARKGPRGRGRSYWPGFVLRGDLGENGVITGPGFAATSDAFDSFWTDMDNSFETGTQVILQRDEPEQKSPPISPPPPVVSRVLQARIATQRRRLRR